MISTENLKFLKTIKDNFSKDNKINESDIKYLFDTIIKNDTKKLNDKELKEYFTFLSEELDKLFKNTMHKEMFGKVLNIKYQHNINQQGLRRLLSASLYKMFELKEYCEKKNHLPINIKNDGRILYQFYTNWYGSIRTKEQESLIEEITKKYSTKTNNFETNYELLVEYCENNGHLPIASTEKGRKLYQFYTNSGNTIRTPEQKSLIEEITKKYSTKTNNFETNYELLVEYCENNGHLPIARTNNGGSLYQFYTNSANSKRTPKQKSLIEEIIKKYSTKNNNFETNYELLVEYCENNGHLPISGTEEGKNLYQFYTNFRNSKRTPEQENLIKEITTKYPELQNISYEEKIEGIYSNIEELVELLSLNKKPTKIVGLFSEIQKLYSQLYVKEKQQFEKQNKEINDFIQYVLSKDYETLNTKTLNEIQEEIFKIIQNYNEQTQGKITGDYIAWNLNKKLYLEEENDQEIQLGIVNDIGSLKNILKYLKFKNKTKEQRQRIIGGLDMFLQEIKLLDKNGEVDKETLSAVRAEMLSHITLFFENFNPEDFENLIKELEGKTQTQFVDTIIEKINNSSLVVPVDSKQKAQNLFNKNKSGQWVFSMKGTGRLDNHVSYNKKRITGSVTTSSENGWEGGQLLFHPMKDKVLKSIVFEFIMSEIVQNDKRIGNTYVFSENSILAGLEIQNFQEINGKTPFIEQNLQLKVGNEDLFENNNFFEDKDLIKKQLEKMESTFLINKLIYEGSLGKGNHGEKSKTLSQIKEQLIKVSSENYEQTALRYKQLKGKSEKDSFDENDIEQSMDSHVFFLRSVTLKELDDSDNELILELYLKNELSSYKEWIKDDLDDKFLEKIDLKNPLVKTTTKTMVENNNAAEFCKCLIDFNLQEDLKVEDHKQYLEKLEKYISDNEENYNIPQYSSKFISKLFQDRYKKLIRPTLTKVYQEGKKQMIQTSSKTKDQIQQMDDLFIQNYTKSFPGKDESIAEIVELSQSSKKSIVSPNDIKEFKIIIKSYLISDEEDMEDIINIITSKYTLSEFKQCLNQEEIQKILKGQDISEITSSIYRGRSDGNMGM